MIQRALDVTLEPVSHIYTDSQNIKYDSVTTIIKNYKEEFDPYKITREGRTLIANYVLEHGHTEEYWLNKWEKNRDTKANRGTEFHKQREDSNHRLTVKPRNMTLHNICDVASQVANNPGMDYSQLKPGVYSELTIFNRQYKIAGQADEVIIYGDKTFDIDDHKTNGDFTIRGFSKFYKGKRTYKTLLPPLTAFEDCHHKIYTLQLSLYAWMLEQFGLKCRNLRALHYMISPEDEALLLQGIELSTVPPMTVYPLKYEKIAVERMIQDFVSKRDKNVQNHR